MIKVITFIFISTIALLVISCQTEESEPTPFIKCVETVNYIDIIDTSRMTIIPLSNATWLNENYRQAPLSIPELFELDTLLAESCFAYNLKVRKEHAERIDFYREEADFMGEPFVEWEFRKEDMVMDLSNYRRQYVPYYNEIGEKVVQVYANCLSFEDKRWKTTIISVNDGGNCHFHAILNLTTGKCEQMLVNGYA